jgi:hypothetical protein
MSKIAPYTKQDQDIINKIDKTLGGFKGKRLTGLKENTTKMGTKEFLKNRVLLVGSDFQNRATELENKGQLDKIVQDRMDKYYKNKCLPDNCVILKKGGRVVKQKQKQSQKVIVNIGKDIIKKAVRSKKIIKRAMPIKKPSSVPNINVSVGGSTIGGIYPTMQDIRAPISELKSLLLAQQNQINEFTKKASDNKESGSINVSSGVLLDRDYSKVSSSGLNVYNSPAKEIELLTQTLPAFNDFDIKPVKSKKITKKIIYDVAGVPVPVEKLTNEQRKDLGKPLRGRPKKKIEELPTKI